MHHLYIRHAIGGTLLLDSLKHAVPYELEARGDEWVFTIARVSPAVAGEVLGNRSEINIFVVAEGDPPRKAWFSTDGQVEYNPAHGTLTIIADVRLDYSA